MPVYVVALIEIKDRERYRTYENSFMDVFSQYQGKMLSVDDNGQTLEGNWAHSRTVLIEFPDNDALQSWYHSDAYQALLQHRVAAATANIGVVQGL